MDAPYLYAVKMWLNPDGGERVMAWMDGGHQKEVASQPGFLWSRRFRLNEKSPDGWQAYIVLYGVTDEAALDAYQASPTRQRFARESAEFDTVMRTERFHGPLEVAIK